MGMNCAGFEDLLDEMLDARSGATPELEHRLDAHASGCPGCRASLVGYQVLRQAVAALEPPPVPSAEATGRLLRLMATVPAHHPARPRPRVVWAALATAAALLALAWSGTPGLVPAPPPLPGPIARPSPPVAAPRPLGPALAEARSASIELAREASAPATRIGREVLGGLDEAADLDLDSGPAVADPPGPEPSEMFHAVGERVNAGVRPISGSARHAFGFLLGPPPTGPTHADQDSL